MPAFSCGFIFFGDDAIDALQSRVIAALESEGFDFDPAAVSVERISDDEALDSALDSADARELARLDREADRLVDRVESWTLAAVEAERGRPVESAEQARYRLEVRRTLQSMSEERLTVQARLLARPPLAGVDREELARELERRAGGGSRILGRAW